MDKIAVFGCGEYYQFKVKAVSQKYDIVAIIDNRTVGREGEFQTPIYTPAYLIEHPELPVMIMTARFTFMDIFQQLISLGITSERILFAINESPFYDVPEDIINKMNGTVVAEAGKAVIRCSQGNYYFSNIQEYTTAIRTLYEVYDSYVKLFQEMPLVPASHWFGREFGNPVDRFFIEAFLESNAAFIRGDVAEMGDSTYTFRYGHNIENAIVFSAVSGEGTHLADFATGDGICEAMADCLICTQTIQMIFDIEAAVESIYKLLKPGGVALLTAHGISKLSQYDYTKWGEYWHFTPQSLERVLTRQFGSDNVEVKAYGNVKTACAFLYGLCQEYLCEQDFLYNDEQYPVIISAVCRKPIR